MLFIRVCSHRSLPEEHFQTLSERGLNNLRIRHVMSFSCHHEHPRLVGSIAPNLSDKSSLYTVYQPFALIVKSICRICTMRIYDSYSRNADGDAIYIPLDSFARIQCAQWTLKLRPKLINLTQRKPRYCADRDKKA